MLSFVLAINGDEAMLPHAMLAIQNPVSGEFLAIPITNFPVLPIGSQVDIRINDDIDIDMATIESYKASNRHGAEVEIKFFKLPGKEETGESEDAEDRLWQKIAKLCVKDTSHLYDLIYPQVIDFGTIFPLPPN